MVWAILVIQSTLFLGIIVGAVGCLLNRIIALRERIAALEKRVGGSGPALSPRSSGLPQSGGHGGGWVGPWAGPPLTEEELARFREAFAKEQSRSPSPQRW
jgi:hypothetical protein